LALGKKRKPQTPAPAAVPALAARSAEDRVEVGRDSAVVLVGADRVDLIAIFQITAMA